ncbi:MAG: hypothetical protein O2820_18930 [Planctomycetota bacterium]|nr:hypothetical protein [Planctomycetota bacterium]
MCWLFSSCSLQSGKTRQRNVQTEVAATQGKENSQNYQKTAEILIVHGADMNRVTEGGRQLTPLDDALAAGNEAVAEVLRKHGARASDRQE